MWIWYMEPRYELTAEMEDWVKNNRINGQFTIQSRI